MFLVKNSWFSKKIEPLSTGGLQCVYYEYVSQFNRQNGFSLTHDLDFSMVLWFRDASALAQNRFLLQTAP